MKKTYVEYTCDFCGMADHYLPNNSDKEARSYGWIITSDKKHFCCKECYKDYKNGKKYEFRHEKIY